MTKGSGPGGEGAGGKAGGARKKPRGATRHEHSAGVVLYREVEGRRLYLLLDYGKHWDYPKGHLEAGETPWRAAVRELREETGIRQIDRVGRFQRDMVYFFFSPKKGRVQKVVTFFAGKTTTEAVTISDEHRGYAWMPYEEALARLTYDNAKQMLRAAEKNVAETLARRTKSPDVKPQDDDGDQQPPTFQPSLF